MLARLDSGNHSDVLDVEIHHDTRHIELAELRCQEGSLFEVQWDDRADRDDLALALTYLPPFAVHIRTDPLVGPLRRRWRQVWWRSN